MLGARWGAVLRSGVLIASFLSRRVLSHSLVLSRKGFDNLSLIRCVMADFGIAGQSTYKVKENTSRWCSPPHESKAKMFYHLPQEAAVVAFLPQEWRCENSG